MKVKPEAVKVGPLACVVGKSEKWGLVLDLDGNSIYQELGSMAGSNPLSENYLQTLHDPSTTLGRITSSLGHRSEPRAVVSWREKIMCISEPKSDSPHTLRKGHDQPAATSVHGWRYHHIGIPTDVPRPGEYYLKQFKMYVSAFETSPCGIQWMRFEPDSPVHPLIKSVPHIAFEVDDLQAAMEGKEILTAPNSPSEGVTVAMILDSGAPVELLEFRRDRSTGPTR